MLRAFLTVALAATVAATAPIVLKPTKTGPSPTDAVAFVMLQGAQIDAKTYEPLFKAVQAASEQEVWAALPSSLGNVVNPATIGGCIKDALSSLKSAGFNGTNVFYAGHSLGGAMLELHAFDSHDGMAGLVLMGSFIARKHRGPVGKSFPIPVLTLAGELDGLARVTRNGAEAFRTQIGATVSAAPADAIKNFPVVVLPGVSHMQYASGTPPLLVKERDLMPEVSYDDAHAAMAKHISNFVAVQTASSTKAEAATEIAAALTSTGVFVKPIVDALNLEGSPHLNPPCVSDFPTNPSCNYPKWPAHSIGPAKGPPNPLPPKDCTCGSDWVMHTAQALMAGFANSPRPQTQIHTADAFEDVSDVRPFHLPHIFNAGVGPCAANATSGVCVLNTTTVDMPIYEQLDSLDTGFASISAYEHRVKLKSREAMWQAAGMDIDFNESDNQNKRCREINQAALDWATKGAGASTLERYNKMGQKYEMIDDTVAGFGITGPKWIKMGMIYKDAKGPEGKMVKTISSPTFTTKNKNNGYEPFIHTVGYHYCKLMSPARIMEWIYVDSLREYDSLANHSSQSGSSQKVKFIF